MLGNLYKELGALEYELSEANKSLTNIEKILQDTEVKLKDDLDVYQLCINCLLESRDLINHVSTLVTEGLQHIYGPETSLKFIFSYDSKGDFNGLKCAITHNGFTSDSFDGKVGDGVSAAASLLVYLAIICMHSGVTKILFLDEPVAQMHVDSWQKMVEVIESWALEYELQVFITTHAPVETGSIFYCNYGTITKN